MDGSDLHKARQRDPRVEQVAERRPEVVILAHAEFYLHGRRKWFGSFFKAPNGINDLPRIAEFLLSESELANIIDGLLDVGADGLSKRFESLAECTDAACKAYISSPNDPAVLVEFMEMLATIEHWCRERVSRIWRLALTPEEERVMIYEAFNMTPPDALKSDEPDLDRTDYAILGVMRKQRNKRFRLNDMAVVNVDNPDVPRDTGTISKRWKKLKNAGLIDWPEGSRKGAKITEPGLTMHIPD